MMISNTPTLTSYTFNYFLDCILILILMFILWIIYVIFHERIFKKYWKYFLQLKKETFFIRRSINDNMNFEMLVKIREQSQRLLPYRHMSPRTNRLVEIYIYELGVTRMVFRRHLLYAFFVDKFKIIVKD
jgi:hypothetical protein